MNIYIYIYMCVVFDWINHLSNISYVPRRLIICLVYVRQILGSNIFTLKSMRPYVERTLTLSLLMSYIYIYIYGAHCKARNFNVVYVWNYVWKCWKSSLSICCTMFHHWFNAESFPVSQLCVKTLPATKITLITNWI
jgi:hypothetical protein